MSELWVAGYDLHYPKVDKPTVKAMHDFIERNEVDGFVFGGDQFDNQCISHHTKHKPGLRERGAYKRDEAGFVRDCLDPLDDMLGDAEKVWIVGNHDDWEQDLVDENPEFDGWQRTESLSLADRGWNIIPCGEGYKRGKLLFIHGDSLSGVGNQATVTHARKALDVYAGNVVYGHMHSPQMFTKVLPYDTTQKWQAHCMPILGHTNPTYLKNRPTAWLNGFGIIEFHKNGMFNVYPVVVVNGKFVYGGEEYGS